MSRILVTGGAGFIGSHLAERLLKDGHNVVVLDNFSTGKLENLVGVKDAIHVVKGDLRDPDIVAEAVEGCEVVFHKGALPSVPRSIEQPGDSHDANATGTLNVLNAARAAGVRRVVYASSSSAYGDTPESVKVETLPTWPLSPYGVAKLTGEHYCRVFSHVYGFETVSLRYFNVFGPRQDETSQYAAVIPQFISRRLSGIPPRIYGDGTQTRDFTFVENVVDANLAAGWSAEAVGEVINIACGQRTSLLDLVGQLDEVLGESVEPIFEPARAGDIKHSLADIEKARRCLGYDPQVSLQEGLKRTVEWFVSRHSGNSKTVSG
ncbi:MAG: SDR family oxidoreductase [Planctomycetota bacterium]|jgi:UDP-glucose 4-epimerase|nr:SDR family oxidoreductase [Planctomycetota bacterium]